MNGQIRCSACGKYIGYNEMGEGGAVTVYFTPDAEGTIEYTEFIHTNCDYARTNQGYIPEHRVFADNTGGRSEVHKH